jgi:hypothetical protein
MIVQSRARISRCQRNSLLLLISFLLSTSLAKAQGGGNDDIAYSIPKFSFTRLHASAPLYATYQSHNQLIIANSRGIFAAFLDSDADPSQVPRRNSWTLVRSDDGGRTFRTLFSMPGSSMAPAVETDEDDNVYVFAAGNRPGSDGTAGQLDIYKFTPSTDYSTPRHTSIALEVFVDKFSVHYDRTRRQMFFAPYLNVPMLVLDTEGRVLKCVRLFSSGPNALLEYPRLSVDQETLYLSWTTATPVKPWRYYSIHAMSSGDGGLTWSTPSGNRILLPTLSDDTGPVPLIARNAWLAGFSVLNGTAHFMYLSDQEEVYRRIEWGNDSHTSLNKVLEVNGVGINSLDGFFTVGAGAKALFAVGADFRKQTAEGLAPIVALVSRDNGKIWHVHSTSEPLFRPYALGGPRFSTDQIGIIGLFTNFNIKGDDPGSHGVYFFRIR